MPSEFRRHHKRFDEYATIGFDDPVRCYVVWIRGELNVRKALSFGQRQELPQRSRGETQPALPRNDGIPDVPEAVGGQRWGARLPPKSN